MSDAPVRVGFVGCGKQASASWYPNFATIPELDLYACCDLQGHWPSAMRVFLGREDGTQICLI